MRLYEFAPSRSIRVRWTLQEMELAFESVSIDMARGEHRSSEFLKVNPAGKLPALVDDDFVLTESVAIVLYLADKHPEKALLPSAPRPRAEANRWLLFTVTELEQPLWRIAKHTALYPEPDRLPAEVELARRDFTAAADVLEAHLHGRAYALGSAVSVVDFVLAHTLDWANEVRLLAGHPEARAYVERMYARPRAAMRVRAALASVGL